MNTPIICHFSPEGGVDDRIANLLEDDKINRQYIGSLRAIYDEHNKVPLIPEGKPDADITDVEVSEYAQKLMTFKNNLAQIHLKELQDTTKHVAKTFAQLYKVDGWDASKRQDRINLVSHLFTSKVSQLQRLYLEKGIKLSRQDIVNGYKEDGKYYFGQAKIFEKVFNLILTDWNKDKEFIDEFKDVIENPDDYEYTEAEFAEIEKVYNKRVNRSEEWSKIFNNWSALCTFARIRLRDTEGLKLGATLEYASEATPDNFNIDSNFEDLYNEEESIREAWQVMQEEISAFGSMGKETRKFLSTVKRIDRNGKEVGDGLGYLKYEDPITLHQKLSDLLRGVTSESGLIRKLWQLSAHNTQLKEVFHNLATYAQVKLEDGSGNFTPVSENNKPGYPVLITQLLEDLHKNFVPYSGIIRKGANLYAKILNRQDNPLRGEFALRVEASQILPGEEGNSIYNKEGKMNFLNYMNFVEEANRLIPDETPKTVKGKAVENENKTKFFFDTVKNYGNGEGFWSKDFTKMDRISYLVRASRAIGIPLDTIGAMSIYDDPIKRKEYLSQLHQFAYHGFRSVYATKKEFNSRNAIFDYIRKDNHTPEEREAYNEAVAHLKGILDKYSYRRFLDATYGFNGNEKEGFAKEAAGKLLDIVASVTTNLKEERRVAWFDKHGKTTSRYSDRTPCYMGDMVDKIHAFVQEGDAQGLRNFIMDKWGSSSFFYNKETGKWRNKWLEELYNSIQPNSDGSITIKHDSLAKLFGYNEFLGSDFDGKHKIFEDFSTKQHASAMLLQYIQGEGSYGKRHVSRYPCFILGDSGKQMFFTSRHYEVNEVEDFIRKEVLEQEFERIKYAKATNEILLKFFADQYGYKYTDEAGNELRDEDTGRLILKDSEGNIIDESKYKELGYRPVDNFSQTEDEFTMLSFLNKDFENGKYWRILTGNSREELSDAEVAKLSKREAMEMAINSHGEYRKKAIDTYLRDSFEKFLGTLEKLDIIGKAINPKTKEISTEDYADIYKENKGTRTYTVYTDKTGYFGNRLKGYRDMTHMLMDFFYNTKFATMEQLQMFTVDPAFYNHKYPIKDLQKRYKEIYAPGKGISLEARDYNRRLYSSKNYQSVVYFDDISVNSENVNPEFMEMIAQQYGKDSYIYKLYTDNTMTDGQGYRSLDSYRAIKGMAGEWTIPMENAYKQIKQIRSKGNITSEDIKQLSSLMVFFQPIKPYLYTLERVKINDSGDSALIPVQHKYAEIVLIPELMQDGKLKDLALWMENHKDENGEPAPIDLVASTKAVKVGAFGSVPLKGMNDTAAIYDTMNKAYVHKLSLSDYRVQSGVPEHLNHGQLVGTQARKLFFSNINRKGDYSHYLTKIFGDVVDKDNPTIYVPGLGKTHLNGKALVSLYNSLIMAGMFESYKDFEAEVGDSKSLSDKMIQNIISNANQNEDNMFAFSIIDDPKSPHKGEFMVPLSDPALEHDSSSLLFSLFRNYISKQRIKGGSAVQASAMGLSGRKAADSGNLYEIMDRDSNGNYNVLYDEIEMPFNLSYTSSTGKNIPLDFTDWCLPDGSLKMSNEIVHKDDSGRYKEFLSWPVSGRDEQGKIIDESQGYQVPLIEKYYPGILNIIAYRIPTERAYSILNCKVVRFSHPEAGGVMKVPSSRTTTAGFDFDIDKLYFFMKEFRQRELSEDTVSDIWNDIYKNHPEIKNALLDVYEEANSKRTSKSEMAAQLQGLINEGNVESPDFLYKYWSKTGLSGTASEYFHKYLETYKLSHPDVNLYEIYNPNISPMENTRAARNNLFIDLFRARLQSPETLKARYTPGGFRGNSNAALKMRVLQYADTKDITMPNGSVDPHKVDSYVESINKGDRLDPEPLYDVSDPTTILIYNQQNQVAGKLIGIFANENTNHVFSSVLHKMTVKEPIQFGDLARHPMGLMDLLHAPEGIDVDTNVAEYLAASVDAVKDPVLNYLNLNSVTADAGALLARLGYTPYEIGLLFNQPIIKSICEYVANNDTFIDYAYDAVMLNMFRGRMSFKLDGIKPNTERLSSSALANNIIQIRDVEEGLEGASLDYKMGQVQVLKLFKDILSVTKDLNSFVQSSRFTASNSVGTTWGDFYTQNYRVDDYSKKFGQENTKISIELYDPNDLLSSTAVSDEAGHVFGPSKDTKILDNDDSLLNLTPDAYMAKVSLNPFAFEQCAYDMKRKAIKKILSKYYPFNTALYEGTRNTIKDLTRSRFLNADMINSIHRELPVYALSKQRGSLFDGEAMHEDSGMTNREFYNKVFPIFIQVLKNELTNKDWYVETPEGKRYSDLINFLKSLTIIGNTVSTSEDYRNSIPLLIVKQGIGGMQSSTASDFTSLWAGVANSNDTVSSSYLDMSIPVSKIARDFYLYNYYKLGYNFNPTSTMHLAPTVLKENLRIVTPAGEESYIDFLNRAKDGHVKMTPNDIIMFAKQYIMNHLDNKNLVYTVKGNALSKIRSKAYNSETRKYKSLFTVSSTELGFYADQFLIPVDKKEGYLAFRPVIAIKEGNNTYYYMASNKGRFNKTDVGSETMTYVRVFPQGKKGLMTRYFGDEGYALFNNNGGKFENVSDVKLSDYKNREEEMSSEVGSTLFEEQSESPIDYWVTSEDRSIFDVFDNATLEKMYKVLEKKLGVDWEAITLEGGEKLKSPVEIFKLFDKSDYSSQQLLKDTYQEVMQDKVKTIDEKGNEINPCK